MHYLTPKNVFVIAVILGMASILGICTLGPSLSGNVGPAGPIPLVSPSQQTLQASANEREIDARYLIKNVGTTNLELGQISTTCGCTAAEVLPRVVPPGGSALVTVKGRPPASGSQQVSIRIASNADPNHEIAMLLTMIGVKPIPYIASASPAVSFGEIDLADIQVFRVETRERLGSKPWLAIPTYSSPLLNVQGGLSSELDLGHGVAHRTYEFKTRFTSIPNPGDFITSIEFVASEASSTPILSVPVHGIVRPRFDAVPASLYATVARDNLPWTFRLWIRSNKVNPKSVKFNTNRMPAPGITIEPVSDTDSSQFLVRVNPEQPTLKHILQFQADGSDEIVQVPLSVEVD